ncbi:MAG TPA: glycosyltransferase family 4 protein [Candidatus Elarobacter sp.]|jgi:glycosyltransferase involved in cell wall biosynthesis|nr:glycosyltransferase family 4 protein [Candidatus Elarobacter sp.]
MRILVAAERLGRAGGMERYLEIVLPALVARGAVVHVLARTIDAIPHGVTAETVVWADEHDAPGTVARAAAERALRAFAPDVAVAHNVMDAGIAEALRAAPRLVYHLHDHRPFCPNGDRVFPRSGRICALPLGRPCAVHSLTDGCAYGPRRRTLTLIHRRERLRDAIAAAETTIVASHYMAERALHNGIPADRVAEIPLPLADDAYAERVTPSGSRTVVFAGRVVPQKGLESLVRAVAALEPRARPLVRALGDGPALAAARAEAARLGVSLDAPGAVAESAVRAAVDDAALVVIPSLWAEPFGYVGIEAFARGRSVAAYDAGGMRTWLDDGGNGVAVARGDERALGAAIGELLDDAARRHALEARARHDAERFRLRPIADALTSAYSG